jgi:hypothetical protein
MRILSLDVHAVVLDEVRVELPAEAGAVGCGERAVLDLWPVGDADRQLPGVDGASALPATRCGIRESIGSF